MPEAIKAQRLYTGPKRDYSFSILYQKPWKFRPPKSHQHEVYTHTHLLSSCWHMLSHNNYRLHVSYRDGKICVFYLCSFNPDKKMLILPLCVILCGVSHLYKSVWCVICPDSLCDHRFSGSLTDSPDVHPPLSVASNPSRSPSFFWGGGGWGVVGGKWWHNFKVISIYYMAHLGQLEGACVVLSVFWGHSDTIPPEDSQLSVWLWHLQIFTNICHKEP